MPSEKSEAARASRCFFPVAAQKVRLFVDELHEYGRRRT